MSLGAWLEKQAPDFLLTGQRFPLAILLAALTTMVVIGDINDVHWLHRELWERTTLGLATGAVLAVAGVYFAESRPEARTAGLLLKYLLPVAAAAAFQITDFAWLVPYALPAVAVLWLSVSPFTRSERGAPREEVQDRFWWMNFQAITTAVIAAVAFLIIAFGLFAIERSLSILFGLETDRLFYRWVLPFAGVFLAPVYWLSTLPRLSAYRAEELEKPDFLPRAFGFLGQFVLVPLLLIYSLILLAYTVQIVVTQRLPQGMIGWMVLGFVVIGAAAWLLLHPPFMRTRALVRLFRAWWFWLTLVPLALFFVAVWTRVDAYGLTEERVLLAAGGVWATILAFAYLAGRGDIRLIPALAGIILLLLSVGPWNYVNLSVEQQLLRVETLLMAPGEGGATFPPSLDAEQQAELRSSVSYLFYNPPGRERLTAVLQRYGLDKRWADPTGVMIGLGYPEVKPSYRDPFTARRDEFAPIDVSETPLLVGGVYLYEGGSRVLNLPVSGGWSGAVALRLTGTAIEIVDGEQLLSTINLLPLTDTQTPTIAQPTLDFTIHGTRMRLVLDRIEIAPGLAEEAPKLGVVDGTLFTSAATPTP